MFCFVQLLIPIWDEGRGRYKLPYKSCRPARLYSVLWRHMTCIRFPNYFRQPPVAVLTHVHLDNNILKPLEGSWAVVVVGRIPVSNRVLWTLYGLYNICGVSKAIDLLKQFLSYRYMWYVPFLILWHLHLLRHCIL